jgi:hypothetical protein
LQGKSLGAVPGLSVDIFLRHPGFLLEFSHLKSVAKFGGAESLVTTLRFSTDLDEQWRLRLHFGIKVSRIAKTM